MIIEKIVNNNVVIAYDHQKGELVVMGSGLGFHKKIGQRINQSKIEKVFVLANNAKLNQRLAEIPLEYLGITEDIVEYAQQQYHFKINHSIYLGLMDHMYYAITRIQENLFLDNPLVQEIKCFYKEFWEIGCFGAQRIHEVIGVDIPDDEIGYIALHVMEACQNSSHKQVKIIFELEQAILKMIKECYQVSTDENSFSYQRLLKHVQYFVERYLSNQEVNENDGVLNEQIEHLFEQENQCVQKISHFLEEKYGRAMSTSEKNYLILHLRHCKNDER